MTTGTIKWYDPSKGFGFVAPDGSATDLFVHRTALLDTLEGDPAEGDKVSFDEGVSPRGPVAVNVRIIERSGIPPRARAERTSYGDSYGSSYSGGSSYGGGYGSSYGAPRSSSRSSVSDAELASAPNGHGTVKRFDSERGFGFIGQGGGSDLFFHHSALNGATVRPGDEVEFKIVQSAKGPRAEQVRVVEE